MKLGKLEIDLKELQGFLVEAKKQGYGSGQEPVRERDGSKTFTYQKGNFHYTDNYAGSLQAPGDEIVRWQRQDGQRIWHMAYSGGMHPEYWEDGVLREETFNFLIEVLDLVSLENPFRGPCVYEKSDFLYKMSLRYGNIRRFSGEEEILDRRTDGIVFSQDFIGGLVVPKTK